MASLDCSTSTKTDVGRVAVVSGGTWLYLGVSPRFGWRSVWLCCYDLDDTKLRTSTVRKTQGAPLNSFFRMTFDLLRHTFPVH